MALIRTSLKTKYKDSAFAYVEGIVKSSNSVIFFMQSPFFLFGSFALLKGTLNSSLGYTIEGQSVGTPTKTDNSITLTSFNAGVGILAGSGVSILLGFRGENSSGEGEGQEKVSGIMATLAYTLR